MKLNKKEQSIVDDLLVGKNDEVITNPFTGVKVRCTPLGVALYDFIIGCNIIGNTKDFDDARYAFMKLFPDEYMKLID